MLLNNIVYSILYICVVWKLYKWSKYKFSSKTSDCISKPNGFPGNNQHSCQSSCIHNSRCQAPILSSWSRGCNLGWSDDLLQNNPNACVSENYSRLKSDWIWRKIRTFNSAFLEKMHLDVMACPGSNSHPTSQQVIPSSCISVTELHKFFGSNTRFSSSLTKFCIPSAGTSSWRTPCHVYE